MSRTVRIAIAMSLTLALIAAVLSAAGESSFEVEVTGDTAFSWKGEDASFLRAIHNPSNGDKQLRIELRPGGKNQEVVFQINVESAAAGDEEGTYAVGLESGGDIPSATAIFCEGACTGLALPMLPAQSGTVTIEEADGGKIVGHFEFGSAGRKVGERVIQPGFLAKGKFAAVAE